MDFVRVKDGQLWADSRPFRFVGTNCYFLQEEATREILEWEGYQGRVDQALLKASQLGLQVVRAWAFNDEKDNPAGIQIGPLKYNEAGLRGMDLAIAKAGFNNIRLILSLCNFWNDYGGIRQYLEWHGLDPTNRNAFFQNSSVINHFKDHLEYLMTRKNHLTGVPWGQDPTIFVWELMNEPRGSGEILAPWIEEMVAHLRKIAPDQLISTGEEGFGANLESLYSEPDQMDFIKNSKLIDIASIHLYPETWGWKKSSIKADGLKWIEDRSEIAGQLGIPLYVGEFGLSNRGSLSLDRRRQIYESWLRLGHDLPHVAGMLSWSFSTDDRSDDWDEFTWKWLDGTDTTDRMNRYADLHYRFAKQFRAHE